MEKEIVNRVEKSPIINFDLEDWLKEIEVQELNITSFLLEGLVLIEKDFREKIKNENWENFSGKYVFIPTTDSIIPMWAYMLLASCLQPFASMVVVGSKKDLYTSFLNKQISEMTLEKYEGKPLIIKGCSNYEFSPTVYSDLVLKLQPVVKTIMFGEACSSVPVYKRKNN